jgi:CBS domain-containing protein
MVTVKHLLDRKGHDVWFVRRNSTVFDALKLMDKHAVGALLVMDGKKVVGIISERDYARKVILVGKSSRQTPVSEIMTRDVVCVSSERTVAECMALMTDKHVRHLPVLNGNHVIGVVSIGDLVQATISEKDFIIGQLEKYINGYYA